MAASRAARLMPSFSFRRPTQHSALSTQHFFLLVVTLLLAGCMTTAILVPTRIALLAPFEGRYREVGYNALYAAHLALQDTGDGAIELLPIDDGGTSASALDRARALALDPQVQVTLVMGYAATAPDTLNAFSDIPVLVVGDWGAKPANNRVFVLSNPRIDDLLTIPTRMKITAAARLDAPFVGGEILALAQFGKLRASLDGVTVVSSASLPDSAFAERYRASDQFAPEPGLLASLTYDAARMALEAIQASDSRAAVMQTLSAKTYSGMNGEIAFENGYWRHAPIHTYQYGADGQLLPVDRVVE